MPLHLPHLGHKRHGSHSQTEKPSPESFVPTSPRSPTSRAPLPPHRGSTTSSTYSDASSNAGAPASILRKTTTTSSTSDSGSSTSASAYLSKRLTGSLAFDREDTISSLPESDEERDRDADGASTPATSVSSFGGQCPLPSSNAVQKFPFFTMTLSSSSTLSFIALPVAMRPAVLDAVTRAWRRGVSKTGQVDYAPELMKKHKEKGCDGGVWEVTLKGDCWVPGSADKVS